MTCYDDDPCFLSRLSDDELFSADWFFGIRNGWVDAWVIVLMMMMMIIMMMRCL